MCCTVFHLAAAGLFYEHFDYDIHDTRNYTIVAGSHVNANYRSTRSVSLCFPSWYSCTPSPSSSRRSSLLSCLLNKLFPSALLLFVVAQYYTAEDYSSLYSHTASQTSHNSSEQKKRVQKSDFSRKPSGENRLRNFVIETRYRVEVAATWGELERVSWLEF